MLKNFVTCITVRVQRNQTHMNKGIITLLGFTITVLGFLSALFTMVGLRFSFFKFITDLGPGLSFLVYIIMIFGGIIIMYISKMDPEQD